MTAQLSSVHTIHPHIARLAPNVQFVRVVYYKQRFWVWVLLGSVLVGRVHGGKALVQVVEQIVHVLQPDVEAERCAVTVAVLPRPHRAHCRNVAGED